MTLGFFLLIITLLLELAGVIGSYIFGIWVFWPVVREGWAILFSSSPIMPETQMGGWIFVAGNLILHLAACMRTFIRQMQARLSLAVPSKRQLMRVQQVYEQLRQGKTEGRRGIHLPSKFLYRPGHDLTIGFLGTRLVIGDILLESPHLDPLLLHEVGHYTSGDVWLRQMLAYFPPISWILLCLAGFPLGLGPLLLGLIWPPYWRWRILVADAFVMYMGSGMALQTALQQIALPRERKSNLLFRETPYVEQRLAHLEYLLSSHGPKW